MCRQLTNLKTSVVHSIIPSWYCMGFFNEHLWNTHENWSSQGVVPMKLNIINESMLWKCHETKKPCYMKTLWNNFLHGVFMVWFHDKCTGFSWESSISWVPPHENMNFHGYFVNFHYIFMRKYPSSECIGTWLLWLITRSFRGVAVTPYFQRQKASHENYFKSHYSLISYMV